MENSNGRELVEAGDLCERRNGNVAHCNVFEVNLISWVNKCLKFVLCAGRGVDLNRNWSVDWGKKEKVRCAFLGYRFSCVVYILIDSLQNMSHSFACYYMLKTFWFPRLCFSNYRIMIHMKKIPEWHRLVSLKLR